MLSTKRLFDEIPYEKHFEATVIYVGDDHIVLDQTLFYPLSGNQDFDIGSIGEYPVTAVHVDNTDEGKLDFSAPIRHYVTTDNFSIGQKIEGQIDSTRRLNTMRLHTASHIVEFFMRKMPTFLSIEGSFVNNEKDRADYFLSQNIDPQSLSALEQEVNRFISQGHEIIFKYQDGIRLWCCNEIEMPCCGTHVSNTKEIGTVKLSRKNKGKGLNRIEIKLV
ncbi:alanyl tRNA synthetase-related protein [Xenorhabdus stockiae]|uniref:Alanyl tRNA synthetase-related protein n=1 Tax=Xenorhabdus stockiae TaxID=351614 RepID=A0A2D0KNY4_9GAMM|nr:alanyl-tRNA editing protein [Xenorhabdus stockiae]PHM65132.1 alanyl tRNA synthetase-related protein [Xenorhabdus stockiae]